MFPEGHNISLHTARSSGRRWVNAATHWSRRARGVFDGEVLVEPELGTAQRSVRSPLLGNVSLHYVLDLWFETEGKLRLRGKATLLRYGDDLIIGCKREDDAPRVLAVLEKRLDVCFINTSPE